MGRVGVPRDKFLDIGGYNQSLFGAGADDICLTQVRETDILAPVLNTKIQTIEYLPNNENYIQYYKDAMMHHTVQMLSTNMQANPQGIGVVDGVDAKQHLVRVL